ncbi:hypothetical protein [Mammaliicoccus sciuri]|uniref:hypothetical protein n=1 Tax=Mammaliicoccus sciuri TaxID=1296 RepID=UPI002B262908|nr:hypothetical protein [Mammaliicoccus sciuri]WQK75206.1 hypothetical protein P3U33_05610 [Mammaliicoccus sciuri]
MKLSYSQWNDETFQEEQKTLEVNNNVFNEWVSQSDFNDLTDFENNYNSDDIAELLNYLDLKTLKDGKEYYKL